MAQKPYDIILVGTKERNDYVGSRTFYIQEIIKNYAPSLKVGIYDIMESEDKRLDCSNAKNIIFLPWAEVIDLGWTNFLMNASGRKILYTENYYWYQEQKNKLLEQGFNLENLFDVIAFSSREHSGWWNDRQYAFWGSPVNTEFFKESDIVNGNFIYIDDIWTLEQCQEPYNALRILNICIPKIKEKHPDIKVITQGLDVNWSDEKIEKNVDLQDMIDVYSKSKVFVVSHIENLGLPQIEAQLCGTKIVTTSLFSNNTALLPGTFTRELWDFESGEESFIQAVENCLNDYDKKEVKNLALQAFNSNIFFKNMIKNLWSIDLKV